MKTCTKAEKTFLCMCLVLFCLLGTFSAEVHSKKLNVVTTTADLASIARFVAGPYAIVTSICSGKEDPHFLQAKPSYIVSARDADLWIRVGMDLEVGWEPAVIEGARNAAIKEGSIGHLDASEKVLRLYAPTTSLTRAMGDVHPYGNPHYWLDPLNGRIVAGAIAERLARLDPSHAEEYESRLNEFRERLDARMFGEDLVREVGGAGLWAWQVRGELGERLDARGLSPQGGSWWADTRMFRGVHIITYHKSWVYFCNRFGLIAAAELEPKPGIPPSGSHLNEVINNMKARKVRLILQEPFYSTKAAELVAERTGAEVVVVANSVGGEPEADEYLSLMDLIVERVRNVLK